MNILLSLLYHFQNYLILNVTHSFKLSKYIIHGDYYFLFIPLSELF